jgi:hypothetical protein
MATEARAEATTSSRWKRLRRSTMITADAEGKRPGSSGDDNSQLTPTGNLPTGGGAGATEAVPLASAARTWSAKGGAAAPGGDGTALPLAGDEHAASSGRRTRTKTEERRDGNGGGGGLMLCGVVY